MRSRYLRNLVPASQSSRYEPSGADQTAELAPTLSLVRKVHLRVSFSLDLVIGTLTSIWAMMLRAKAKRDSAMTFIKPSELFGILPMLVENSDRVIPNLASEDSRHGRVVIPGLPMNLR